MSKEIKADDVMFNFFKQVCDEKDDTKCTKLGNTWIIAMETNLTNMQANLQDTDKIKYKEDITSNKQHLNNLKGKTANEEIEDAEKKWSFQTTVQQSVSDSRGAILIIKNIKKK